MVERKTEVSERKDAFFNIKTENALSSLNTELQCVNWIRFYHYKLAWDVY